MWLGMFALRKLKVVPNTKQIGTSQQRLSVSTQTAYQQTVATKFPLDILRDFPLRNVF
jgi:hypothetical protein